MAITLEPSELGFRRPFTSEVTQTLRLGNKGSNPLAFKVKTTAPKQYCVRPNSGKIEPGHEVEVQVLLQAMKEDPPPDARCKDKFLVQSIAITPERDGGNVSSIWQSVEKLAKDQIEERKIRVVFLPAEGGLSTPTHKQVNGVSGDPPAYEQTPTYGSPQQAVTPNTRSGPSDEKPVASRLSDTVSGASSSIGNTASATVGAVPTSSEQLKNQLAAAQEKIKALTSQVQDQGLRQRKPGAPSQDVKGGTSVSLQEPAAEGVPVQMVAALCLLSFLLAYFFF